MQRFAITILLAGTAFTGMAEAGGSGTRPLGFEGLQHLRALNGQAFDEAWLLEAKVQQDLLCGVGEVARRYTRQQELGTWAEKDCQARQIIGNRLETLRNRLADFPTSTHTDFGVSGDSLADLKAHADAFFRTNYAKQSAHIGTLARLALSRSQNGEVRREAAAVLAFETTQINDFRRLR